MRRSDGWCLYRHPDGRTTAEFAASLCSCAVRAAALQRHGPHSVAHTRAGASPNFRAYLAWAVLPVLQRVVLQRVVEQHTREIRLVRTWVGIDLVCGCSVLLSAHNDGRHLCRCERLVSVFWVVFYYCNFGRRIQYWILRPRTACSDPEERIRAPAGCREWGFIDGSRGHCARW